MKSLFSFILVVLVSYFLMAYNHKCRFALCPYTGITPAFWKEAVRNYSGCEEGSDCYEVDMLHLEFPDKSYDELEDMLFKPVLIT